VIDNNTSNKHKKTSVQVRSPRAYMKATPQNYITIHRYNKKTGLLKQMRKPTNYKIFYI
jgi:hypothetical protein